MLFTLIIAVYSENRTELYEQKPEWVLKQVVRIVTTMIYMRNYHQIYRDIYC
jgi:hypothetical protein